MTINEDFDSFDIFLYKNELYKQLTHNGLIFFELQFDIYNLEFTIYPKYLEDKDHSELILLPKRQDILLHYILSQ